MTIGEIIQRVQSLYSKGVESDDSRLSSRHIFNKLLSVRALLIKQAEQKKNWIGDSNSTILDCLKLELALLHNCPCLPIIGCKVYRTVNRIPLVMEGRGNYMIEYISSLDNERIFSLTSTVKYAFEKSDRFFNSDKAIFKNGYLYIYGKNLPMYITVKAVLSSFIFEDISDCSGDCVDCSPCLSNLDKEFKLQDSLIEPLVTMSQQELVKEFMQMKEDLTNDNKDSIAEQSY
jgi:hypothetical protein